VLLKKLKVNGCTVLNLPRELYPMVEWAKDTEVCLVVQNGIVFLTKDEILAQRLLTLFSQKDSHGMLQRLEKLLYGDLVENERIAQAVKEIREKIRT